MTPLIAQSPLLAVPMWLQLVAVVFGGISGTIVGRRNQFDLSGIVALAIVTGLGGGLLRDILLLHGTPVAMQSDYYILTAAATGLVGALAPTTIAAVLTRIKWPFTLLDAVFVGTYAVVSAGMALQINLPAVPCILAGIVGGVGGSVLRDVFANERPELFRPGTLYAVPTAIGVTGFVLLSRLAHAGSWIEIPALVFIVAVRMLAVWRGWSLPEAADDVFLFAVIRQRVRHSGSRWRRRWGNPGEQS